MDKQGNQEKPVIHITIDKVVLNFKAPVGQVINGEIKKGGLSILMGSYIEEVMQHIYKNRGQVVAHGRIKNS